MTTNQCFLLFASGFVNENEMLRVLNERGYNPPENTYIADTIGRNVLWYTTDEAQADQIVSTLHDYQIAKSIYKQGDAYKWVPARWFPG